MSMGILDGERQERAPEYLSLIAGCKAKFIDNSIASLKNEDGHNVHQEGGMAKDLERFFLSRSFDEIVKIVEAKYPDEEERSVVLRELANNGVTADLTQVANHYEAILAVKPLVKRLLDEESLHRLFEQVLKGRALSVGINEGSTSFRGQGNRRMAAFAMFEAGMAGENPNSVSYLLDDKKFKDLGMEAVEAAKRVKAEKEALCPPVREKALAALSNLLVKAKEVVGEKEGAEKTRREEAVVVIDKFSASTAADLDKVNGEYEAVKSQAIEALRAYQPTDAYRKRHDELIGVLDGTISRIEKQGYGYGSTPQAAQVNAANLREAINAYLERLPNGQNDLQDVLRKLLPLLQSKEWKEGRKGDVDRLTKDLLAVVRGELKKYTYSGYTDDLTTAAGFKEGNRKQFDSWFSRFDTQEAKAVTSALETIYQAMYEKEMAVRKEGEFKRMPQWIEPVISAKQSKVKKDGMELDVSTLYGFKEASQSWRKTLEMYDVPGVKEFLGTLNELEAALVEVSDAGSRIRTAEIESNVMIRKAEKAEYLRIFKELFEKDKDFAEAFATNLSLQQRARKQKLSDHDSAFNVGGIIFNYDDFGTFDVDGRFSLNFGNHFAMQKGVKAMVSEFDQFQQSSGVATERPPVFLDEVAAQATVLRDQVDFLAEAKAEAERKNAELEALLGGIREQMGQSGVELSAKERALGDLTRAKARLAEDNAGSAGRLQALQEEKLRLSESDGKKAEQLRELQAQVEALTASDAAKAKALESEKSRSKAIADAALSFYGDAQIALSATLRGRALKRAIADFEVEARRLNILRKDG